MLWEAEWWVPTQGDPLQLTHVSERAALVGPGRGSSSELCRAA